MANDERSTPQDPSAKPKGEPTRDVALIHSTTPDGEGLNVVRFRPDRVELGAVRPLKDGVPITGEVVTLKPRPNLPQVCDVEVQLPAPKVSPTPASAVANSVASRRGPAQVATAEYRRNWDEIWNRRSEPKLAN